MAPQFEKSTTKPFHRRLERLHYQIRHPFRFRRLVNKCTKHKAIFLHIPKSAGTSIREGIFGGPGAHRTLTSYQTLLAPQLFAECFKFTFVRNPWDRLVSAFFYLKNEDMKSNHRWAKENLSSFEDFNTFVLEWMTPKSIRSYVFFYPQYYFISLEDKQPAVDFIGFYENLAPDFALICNKIKSSAKLEEKNCNSRRARDFREYYTEQTRNIVAELYADDIKLFGYTFDNSSLPAQIAARDKTPLEVMAA